MKQVVLGTCLVVVVAASAALSAVEQSIAVVNQTGLDIDELYMSVANSEDWGEDLLGVDVLANGGKTTLKVSRKETDCLWDLRIIDQQGNAVVYQDLDLCKGSEITLKYEKGQPTFTVK